MKTTASEFCRNFGRFRFDTQREPVEVTSHGRFTGYFASALEFGHYQELKRREREVLSNWLSDGGLPGTVLIDPIGSFYAGVRR